MNLKAPRGIRGVAEWYMSTLTRDDFIKELFDRQTDIALENLKKLQPVLENKIDAVFICGTDFGTQNSIFCSPETYERMWLPYNKKVNSWIQSISRKNMEMILFSGEAGLILRVLLHLALQRRLRIRY
jgi:hypothetical protein